MSAIILLIIALIVLLAGYLVYGRFLSRKYELNDERETPAHTYRDDVDYVPAKAPVLLGHHFSSIAGAAPIIGPIVAAVFGWVAVGLWILLGSIFIGGVHDMSALVASVRHGGKTIGEVIEEHVGRDGKRLFLGFAWLLVVLVISVFAHAVANVFVMEPATATASILFICVAVLFGISNYRFKTPLWISSIIGVILLAACIVAGLNYPLSLSYNTWKILLFVYVFFAATAPVWILLQPRDYLSSFLLYTLLIAGIVGVFAAGPVISVPAFTGFKTDLGTLFPILFVTVACGAISGFHSLVSSGTTSKQLNRETDAKPIAYGSMLIEGLLSIIALITAVTILNSDYVHLMKEGGPIGVFSAGIGRFVSHLGISEKTGTTFAALAISAFALTTLDTATRLGRFMFQEFFEGVKGEKVLSKNRYVGTLVTIAVAAYFTFSGTQSALWPLFGSANQLLASLTLLAVTIWLAKLGKKNNFVKIPMFFMFCVTLVALVFMVYNNIVAGNIPLIILSLVLLAVGIILILKARNNLRKMKA